MDNFESVTSRDPLFLNLELPLGDGEFILPVGFNGEFWLPLGRSVRRERGARIQLDRLPSPTTLGVRSLTGSIRIFLQKVVADRFGGDFDYPRLAVAELGDEGRIVYQSNPSIIAERVSKANRVFLCVHGIIGDTRAMARAVGSCVPGDLVLTFDYENLNTPIQQTAVDLKDRLREVGLAPGNGRAFQIVSHSMGGLIARWFIEKEGGNRTVNRLIMLGTPNNGSPWPTLEVSPDPP